MKTLQNMEISTLGWEFTSWQPEFYPEDLPSDWFFDFYLNHFRLACVPSKVWQAWLVDDERDEDSFEDFADCVNEHNLLLLVADETELTSLQQVLTLLKDSDIGEYVIGVVVQAEQELPPQSIAGYPVSLLSQNLQFDGWHWQTGDKIISGQPLCWIEQLPLDGKEQSALLIEFMQSLQQPMPVALCIADPKVKIASVTNLKTLAELLGY
ncbi:conserved hypothetical protein [uncultured Thiomicrorhabdus sp.]